MRFHDPRAQPSAPEEPYALEASLASGDVVGLLANGFADSARFLGHVGAALQVARPGIELRHFAKPNASMVADDPLLEGITKECKVVVTAYGH